MRIGAMLFAISLAALVAAPALAREAEKPIEFYVSVTGDDAGAGTLASPFASITRARDAVRAARAKEANPRPTIITLRSGTYYLPATLVLSPEDSRLTVRAYRNERATVSGGKPIIGLQPVEIDGKKLWAVEIPEVAGEKSYFHSLYKDGKTLPRTRLPKQGYYRVANPPPDNTPLNVTSDNFQFHEGEMSDAWTNPTDIEAVVLDFWEQSRMPLVRVDDATRTAYFSKKSGTRLTDDFTPAGARYYVENIFEALDDPGQWYLNRQTGMLCYMPMPGEDILKTTLIAPVNERLIWIQGNAEAEQFVEQVSFEGIHFAHADWSMPPNRSGYEQASWGVPGAICIAAAKDCAIRDCVISQMGGYAIQVAVGASGTIVARNTISDIGAGAISMHRGSSRTIVTDNEIFDGGKVFHSGVGVLIMDSSYNHVAHNHIHNFDYTGVSAGWCWSYDRNNAKANVIEYNHIHDIGRGVLSDLAGIYTLGPQPGTVIRNNVIHDCSSNTYGGWGIYLDAASSYMRIENNIAYRNKSGGFFQPSGRENVLRNNIFALNREAEIAREKAEEHTSFTFRHNIVYWTEGDLLAQNWDDNGFKFDKNLYWKVDGESFLFGKDTFDQWKARGHDVHSLIADPMFRSPETGDFALLPGSPAEKIGYKPIDASKVGPRKSTNSP